MKDCSLTWELDSLYPHPETAEFRAAVDASKAALGELAERSNSLDTYENPPESASTCPEKGSTATIAPLTSGI